MSSDSGKPKLPGHGGGAFSDGAAPQRDEAAGSDIPGTEIAGGRLTLDFSGPPLALPVAGEANDSAFPIPAPAKVSTVPPRTAHDAWTRDKARRSTVDEGAVLADLSAQYRVADEHVAGVQAVETRKLPGSTGSPDNAEVALSLVERRRPSYPAPDHVGEMRERFALGDFTAALRAAEMVLGRDPEHGEAQQTRGAARRRLEDLYRSRFGSDEAVPVVVVQKAEIRWLGLDHQSAYLLSRIDGGLTIGELLDICGLDVLDALKAFALLVESRAIELK